ncbi:MAG: caspase family protein [Myxococcaceae bacterium]|nr:caspase family protein [Myxococcaceae bacterium]
MSGVLPLLLLALAGASPQAKSYALVVGNNQSLDPKVADLRFADDDAARYYELFSARTTDARLLTVLDQASQKLYPGLASKARPPTKVELLRAFEALNAAAEADRAQGTDSTLYFVFSGHGRRTAAGDGTIQLVDGELTRDEFFEQIVGRSKATWLHVIVDACDSYFFVNARGVQLPASAPATEAVAAHLADHSLERHPNVGAIVSTTSEQESHEWQAIGSGVFSHQVRSALSGAADVNADGRVEYSELAAFVAAANAQVTDPRQRVNVSVHPAALDRTVPLVDVTLPSTSAHLLLPRSLSGHYWLEDELGVRVVEFNKEAGTPLLIAFPGTRTTWLRTEAQEARLSPRPGEFVDASTLTFSSLARAAKGATDAIFRQRLFAEAYGPRFYQGFVSSSGDVPVAPSVAEQLRSRSASPRVP